MSNCKINSFKFYWAFKILIIAGILGIIIPLLFALQKEEIKVHDVNEAFSLLKENYSLECIEKHIYF